MKVVATAMITIMGPIQVGPSRAGFTSRSRTPQQEKTPIRACYSRRASLAIADAWMPS